MAFVQFAGGLSASELHHRLVVGDPGRREGQARVELGRARISVAEKESDDVEGHALVSKERDDGMSVVKWVDVLLDSRPSGRRLLTIC